LERILLTPIPWSYAAHIYEVAWLYCIILVGPERLDLLSDATLTERMPIQPFQLYKAFGWIMIPATVVWPSQLGAEVRS
jgi:hypothetical protein